MLSIFNDNLQTDMGRTIVRRHLTTTHAQSIWGELSGQMRTSSKGASEKRRLTQCVTNTVLDDNFRGTTEQFVLHFNEQFRQLDEISDASEKPPDRIPSTTPGAEPPRDAKDSGSARSHSTHLETSSSNRP